MLKQEIIDILLSDQEGNTIEEYNKLLKFTCKDFLEKNALPWKGGIDALYIAVKNGKHHALVAILSKFTYPPNGKITSDHPLWNSLHDQDESGKNILHTAAMTPDNSPCLATLIQLIGPHGSLAAAEYVNLTDGFLGATAMHFAAGQLRTENLSLLRDYGATDYNLRITNAESPNTCWEEAVKKFDKTLGHHTDYLRFFAEWMYAQHDKDSLRQLKAKIRENIATARTLSLNSKHGEGSQEDTWYNELFSAYQEILKLHIDYRRQYIRGHRPTQSWRKEQALHADYCFDLQTQVSRDNLAELRRVSAGKNTASEEFQLYSLAYQDFLTLAKETIRNLATRGTDPLTIYPEGKGTPTNLLEEKTLHDSYLQQAEKVGVENKNQSGRWFGTKNQ